MRGGPASPCRGVRRGPRAASPWPQLLRSRTWTHGSGPTARPDRGRRRPRDCQEHDRRLANVGSARSRSQTSRPFMRHHDIQQDQSGCSARRARSPPRRRSRRGPIPAPLERLAQTLRRSRSSSIHRMVVRRRRMAGLRSVFHTPDRRLRQDAGVVRSAIGQAGVSRIDWTRFRGRTCSATVPSLAMDEEVVQPPTTKAPDRATWTACGEVVVCRRSAPS